MSSSASLPSPDDDYAAPLDAYLNKAFWDAALTSVGTRIRALEAVKADWEELISTGTGQALAVIQANVEPQLVALTAVIDQLKADVSAAEDAIAVINAGGINMSSVVGLSAALALKADLTYVDAAIAALKGDAPAAYDTLVEIAAKLSEDDTAITGLLASIAEKVPVTRKLIGGTGVKLNGGAEANLAGDVTITVAGVPTGAVMGFDLPAPPIGWIVGVGSAINRHTYADLDAVKYCGDALNATATAWYRCTDPANPNTTRSVTGDYLVTRDLRGVFPRFLDSGRGLDSGRVLGSQQGDAIRNITGSIGGTSNDASPPWANYSGAFAVIPGARPRYVPTNAAASTDFNGIGFDASLVVPIAAENRPVNIALLGCIKY
ncbi:hypothetical protein [Pleomorphomonas carboxyditropha]|uniref:Phage tail collar domain-containing protein n=1 Tax=Pleomorphomonas carboxyditropha TaxID=2023338 RepID=A0A2G9WV41_9HYPH|nr:hypothetical protein [Pleomorphomonas carboxyditropha]PIO98576.1 hypothetical protein CJ014_14760 [Pleomorphomonas carboxyditropha]